MGTQDSYTLLSPEDGAAVATHNPAGKSPVLLVCEHASRRIPASLDGLGLSIETAKSHVAWDPGALAVASMLSETLDATLIAARFSRLVYDCNRPPEAAGATPAKSEIFEIAGNADIPPAQRAARIAEIYEPFCDAVSGTITKRIAQGTPPVIVTIHSFTPVYYGENRTVELGVLHDTDATLAEAMLALPCQMNMQRNQPYGPEDGVTHTLKLHALPDGLLNVMIEVRNDLLTSEADQKTVADGLAAMLTQALDALTLTPAEAAHV